jgi:phytoene dehydrogenase-like protein
METNHYDAVVHGDDLTGLVTSCLLAHRGLRTLLVGHDRVSPTVAAGRHVMGALPSLLPPLELGSVRRVFAELNLIPIVRRRSEILSPKAELVLPQGRFDLGAPDSELVTALGRAFPEAREHMRSILSRLTDMAAVLEPILSADLSLPPIGFWERREAARYQSRLPTRDTDAMAPLEATHPLRAGISAIASLSSNFAPSDLGRVPVAQSFANARRGFHRFQGGNGDLRAMLFEKLQTDSGELRARAFPANITLRRGRAAGIQLRPRDEFIGLEHLIWAAPISELLPFCDEKSGRRLREFGVGIRPACYKYCLSALLSPEGLGEPRPSRIFSVLDPTRPLLEDNAIVVTVGAPSVPEGPSALWIECLVPAGVVTSDRSYLSFVRSRVLDHVRRLFPGWDGHVQAVVSAHDGLPAEVRDETGQLCPVSTSTPIAAMPAVLSSDLPRSLDVGAVPHASGVRNLHLASTENLPGLGLEGPFVSAWNVARIVANGRQRRSGTGGMMLLGDA